MSRSEWWTIVVLLGAICFLLTLNLVYQHFIWRDVVDMWKIILEHDLYAKAKKLHMGDTESREYREGSRGVLGEGEPPLPKDVRDAGARGPFFY